jgi:hypothetical protein
MTCSSLRATLVLAAIVAGAGCAVNEASENGSPSRDGSVGGEECVVQVTPDACPVTPPPSYTTDIVPILNAKCNNCHVAGEDDAPWPLTEYEHVRDWRLTILQQIVNCEMPPPDDPTKLTADEEETLVAWLACGAPGD